MTNMAQQHHFSDAIMVVGKRECPRRFVLLSADDISSLKGDKQPVSGTVLETRVTELRLVKLGSSDASYALRIQVRVRLVRAADGAVLSDTTLNYQTEPDLFLDWALSGGEPFMSCVRTGYRHIASQIIADINRGSGEALVVVGSGRNNVSVSPMPLRLAHASIQRQANPIPRVATIQFAAQPTTDTGNIFVIPSPCNELFSVQKPLTRDEALSEAMSDIEWAMDGLDRHPNAVVVITTFAVMSPVGLYHQTIGAALNGVSKKSLQAAEQPVARAINASQPCEALAIQITQQLQQREFVAVLLPNTRPGVQAELARADSATRSALAAWHNKPANSFATGDRCLKIEVVKAALKGPECSNPKLAVCLEARLTLLRASDGVELYASTVRYQGAAHKFAKWAVDDARLLRAEIAHGYEQLSAAAIDQMLTHHWITPPQSHLPTVARN